MFISTSTCGIVVLVLKSCDFVNLLTKKMPDLVGDFDQTAFKRLQYTYKDLSSVFHLKDVNYTRQFAHIYAHRLVQMRDILLEKIQQKWGNTLY